MGASITTATAEDSVPTPAAASPLVERHRGWLERLVASRTCSRDSVDDVLQEVALAFMIREDAALMGRALAGLGHDDRQVLEWKYVEGRTYPQLAAALGVPRHVVEYRVVTAKKRLRGLLIDMGLGGDES